MKKISRKKLVVFLLSLVLQTSINSMTFANSECVILIHGLGRTQSAMSEFAAILKRNHYEVVNHRYPSTRNSVEALADQYIPAMVDECSQYHPERIHFVTHSLGGIILQKYLETHTIEHLSSIVMLGPPNHGSPLADMFHKNELARFILGPVLSELTTTSQSVKPKDLPADHSYKIGIIAGNYTINPLGSFIFKEPNDGKVSVSSTQLDHMNDFIVLPVSHTFMIQNEMVERQVLSFIHNGHFIR